jgi:hypothetical protein
MSELCSIGNNQTSAEPSTDEKGCEILAALDGDAGGDDHVPRSTSEYTLIEIDLA